MGGKTPPRGLWPGPTACLLSGSTLGGDGLFVSAAHRKRVWLDWCTRGLRMNSLRLGVSCFL